MKARVLQSNFKIALDRAVLAVENKPSMPVLSNVLLHAEYDRLHVRAVNLSKGFGIRISIGANVEVDGETTLPAKVLKDLASNWSNDAVTIALNKTTETTNFKCGGSKSNVKGISADEFAPYRDIEGVTFEISAQHLKKMIASASVAAADEDHRPALTGIFTRMNGDCTMTVATADGYRLFVDLLPVSNESKGQVLVPHNGLEAVAKMIDKDDGVVTITFNDEYLKVVSEHWEVGIQLLDSKFPPFERVIPKAYTTRARIDRDELLQALKAAEVFARDSAFSVKFNLKPNLRGDGPGKLFVTGKSQERGDFEAEIDTEWFDGSEVELSANSLYLREFVAQDHGEVLQFNANGRANPASITVPLQEYPLYIVMPMDKR